MGGGQGQRVQSAMKDLGHVYPDIRAVWRRWTLHLDTEERKEATQEPHSILTSRNTPERFPNHCCVS